jgi:hypothetical protein
MAGLLHAGPVINEGREPHVQQCLACWFCVPAWFGSGICDAAHIQYIYLSLCNSGPRVLGQSSFLRVRHGLSWGPRTTGEPSSTSRVALWLVARVHPMVPRGFAVRVGLVACLVVSDGEVVPGQSPST